MKIIRSPFLGQNQFADLASFLGNSFVAAPYLDRNEVSGHIATDVLEDENNFYARFEVPGIKKEDVKVDLNDRLLTISAEKKEKRGDGESSSSYTRSISVPDSVNAETIAARLEDGVLTVTLPKSEERKPRTIQVA